MFSLHGDPLVLTDSAKSFLGGEDQVEEAVLVHLLPIQLRHGHRHWGEGRVIHQEKKCLSRMKLEASPDDLDELPNGDVVRDQNLVLSSTGSCFSPENLSMMQ